MTFDAEKAMQQATQSTAEQRKAAQAVLDSAFDAADRAIWQRAADATIKLASTPTSDPI